MDKKIPSYEEFRACVKEHFKQFWSNLSDAEVEKYLSSEEAVQEIRREYNEAVADMKAGKITEKNFLIGYAGGVGTCLAYMY